MVRNDINLIKSLIYLIGWLCFIKPFNIMLRNSIGIHNLIVSCTQKPDLKLFYQCTKNDWFKHNIILVKV